MCAGLRTLTSLFINQHRSQDSGTGIIDGNAQHCESLAEDTQPPVREDRAQLSSARLCQRVNVIMMRCFSLIPITRRYRPELHYMRGPGPKWYAQHQDLPRTAFAETRDRVEERSR